MTEASAPLHPRTRTALAALAARALAALVASVLLALAGPPGVSAAACRAPITVEQPFPTASAERTRWVVHVCGTREGVVVARAEFRTAPGARFVQVLDDARVAEIFVPYHDGHNRFFDVSDFAQGLVPLGAVECPPAVGRLALGDRVCIEVRDRGLAWKDDTGSRRGEELRLWGVIAVTNYKYVVEWTFRDDGAIEGRVGATGRNLPTHHDSTHMHTVTWRLDVDLDGPGGNSARVARHREQGLVAKDPETLVAREGAISWEPGEFTTLGVYGDGLANDKGRRTAYRLMPLRSGRARHAEAFTQADFWVTRQTPATKGAELRARDLPSYVTPPESVVSGDLVIWYTASLHHIERDEDDDGPTQAMYVGFQLMPANLFSASPLYP
jgi:primary-amine oxidase